MRQTEAQPCFAIYHWGAMHRFTRFFPLPIALTACLFITACDPEATSGGSDAVGAYEKIIVNLRACGQDEAYQESPNKEACDLDKVWDTLDAQSKLMFVEAYASLVRIDRIIEIYFDPIEHKDMRSRTGTDIIASVPIKNAKSLFRYVFKPGALVFDEATNSGVKFSKDIVDQNPNIVTIQTHYQGQKFIMMRESDGVWRNAGLRNVLADALAPIFSSEDAMKEYAKGNLATEIERRKKVLDYFLIQQEMRKQQAKIEKPATNDGA